jgi:hypothetical protein
MYKKVPVQDILRLNLVHSTGVSDETVIRFHDDASKAFDSRYDAYQRGGNSVVISSHSTESEEDDEALPLVINSVPFLDGDTVKLKLDKLLAGSYLLDVTENTLSEDAYFVDTETEEAVSVYDLSDVVITVEKGEETIDGRYVIVSKKSDVVAGVNVKESVLRLSVFPNPSIGEAITLKYAKFESGNATVQLLDMMGNSVYTDQASITETAGSLNVSTVDISNGVYILRVTQGDQTVSEKVIINKK